MTDIKINKISVDTVWELFWKAWELARVNYPLTLVITALALVSGAFSQIPFIGSFAAAYISAHIPIFFCFASRNWEANEQGQFEDLVNLFKDKQTMGAMLPLIIANILLAGIPAFLAQLPGLIAIGGLISLLILPLSIVIGMSYPILFFNFNKINYKEAIRLAFDGLMANLGPFIIGLVLATVLLVLSSLACLLPLFFVGMPIIFIYNYLWYRVVYEDLVLEVEGESAI